MKSRWTSGGLLRVADLFRADRLLGVKFIRRSGLVRRGCTASEVRAHTVLVTARAIRAQEMSQQNRTQVRRDHFREAAHAITTELHTAKADSNYESRR